MWKRGDFYIGRSWFGLDGKFGRFEDGIQRVGLYGKAMGEGVWERSKMEYNGFVFAETRRGKKGEGRGGVFGTVKRWKSQTLRLLLLSPYLGSFQTPSWKKKEEKVGLACWCVLVSRCLVFGVRW